jgi:hypothetical protein
MDNAPQDYHDKVRAFIVNHMRRNKESFSFYFDGDAEYESYLKKMAMPRTWCELSLRGLHMSEPCACV